MKNLIVQLLCATITAAFLSGCAVTAAKTSNEPTVTSAADPAFETLRSGGYVLVMRHAHSASGQTNSKGYSPGCTLGPGRGLDDKGYYQAQLWAALMRRENIPVLKAYTSNRCRAWDTASAVAGAEKTFPHASQITTDPAAISAFKAEIEAELSANPGTNIALVSHSNIAPLYGAAVRTHEDELPEGVMSVVDPADWTTIMRISVLDEDDTPRVTVD